LEAVDFHFPPIQRQNECRGHVLDQQIRCNLAGCFSAALKIFSKFVGAQFCEHLLKMFMKDGPPPGPHPGLAGAAVLMNMFAFSGCRRDAWRAGGLFAEPENNRLRLASTRQ
jgi:hypothetical protein